MGVLLESLEYGPGCRKQRSLRVHLHKTWRSLRLNELNWIKQKVSRTLGTAELNQPLAHSEDHSVRSGWNSFLLLF